MSNGLVYLLLKYSLNTVHYILNHVISSGNAMASRFNKCNLPDPLPKIIYRLHMTGSSFITIQITLKTKMGKDAIFEDLRVLKFQPVQSR